MKRDWVSYALMALVAGLMVYEIVAGNPMRAGFEASMLFAAWVAPRLLATFSEAQLKYVFPVSSVILLLIVVNLGPMGDGSAMARVYGGILFISVAMFAYLVGLADNRMRDLRANAEGQVK